MVKFKKGMKKINGPVVDLIAKRIEKTDLSNHVARSNLHSWLNGVATPEKNPELKAEILRIRHEIQNMG